ASLAPLDVGLHPTQVYDALCGVAIFAVLCAVRRHKRFHGQVMLAYLFLYTIARTAVELFRGDRERGLFFGGLLSTSQLISLGLLGATALFYWQRSRAVRHVAA
ncbi:MAG TPA: prolipoprotein diacylglyceryl transferase family protein, partial [Gemmatimonadales bacterium]